MARDRGAAAGSMSASSASVGMAMVPSNAVRAAQLSAGLDMAMIKRRVEGTAPNPQLILNLLKAKRMVELQAHVTDVMAASEMYSKVISMRSGPAALVAAVAPIPFLATRVDVLLSKIAPTSPQDDPS